MSRYAVGNVARKLYRLTYRTINNSAEYSHIAKDENPAVVALGRAIRETVEGVLDPEEKQWVQRIETLREELLHSEEVLVIPMLGDGKPEETASAEDRFVGRTVSMKVGAVCDLASITRAWALLFLKIMRYVKPENCLELGTSLGISAAYIGAGLGMNKGGRLITLEGAESIAAKARGNLSTLGITAVTVKTGWFNETLGPVLDDMGNVDYAFIDGHHFREPTLAYFERILPFCSDNALLVFDDISTSAEMKDTWRVISNDARIGVVVDLFKKGFCFVSRKPVPKRRYRLVID